MSKTQSTGSLDSLLSETWGSSDARTVLLSWGKLEADWRMLRIPRRLGWGGGAGGELGRITHTGDMNLTVLVRLYLMSELILSISQDA